jgi:addiction module RelE/StbE family toxin
MSSKRVPIAWTRPALDSLLEIVRHIQSDNPSAARRFASSVNSKVARLQRFPESGRMVPEFPSSGLRELIIGDYRIIYRVVTSPTAVQVLAVRHGARLLETPPGTS